MTLRRLAPALLLTLAGCLPLEDLVPTPAGAPLPRCAPAHLVDPSNDARMGTQTQVLDDTVHRLWYPTDDQDGYHPRYEGHLLDEGSLVDASLWDGAPCVHPLVVTSHGEGGYAGALATVIRPLVGAGWVAVAAAHRAGDDEAARAGAIRRAIDGVEALGPDHPLAGRVDTSRVLVIGHGTGAHAAWISGGLRHDGWDDLWDPRVAAVVALGADAPSAGHEDFADVEVPVLAVTGTIDIDEAAEADRASFTPDLTWVAFDGACSEGFVAAPFYPEEPCGTLDHTIGTALAGVWLGAFGAREILGATDPLVGAILSGGLQVDPRITRLR